MINGLVDTPLVFTYADLERFPRENHVYFCECAANSGMEWARRTAQRRAVHPWHDPQHGIFRRSAAHPAGRGRLDAAGDLKDKWVYVEGADASSNGRSIPMEKALDDCLVAFKANGEALRMEHGYPVRLVVPGWEGNMWVKWLRRIEVVTMPRGKPRGNLEIHRHVWPTAPAANGPG
jgi:sulfane dehydrogenase subunit SoxC